MLTLNMPSGDETVSMDVSEDDVEDKTTLVGYSVAVPRPDAIDVARLTVPENPLDPVTTTVAVPADPELIVRDAGLADTAKACEGTVTGMSMECENVDELLAVTETV